MTDAAGHAEMTVTLLAGSSGDVAAEIAKLADSLRAGERPEVVLLSNALLLGLARPLKEALGAPILCTLQGEAPFLDALPEPHRTRAWELLAARARDVDGFLAVSRYTADLMCARAGLERARVHVVPNGLELDGLVPSTAASDPPVVGYVARLPALVDAFLALRARPELRDLRLVAAGALVGGDQGLLAELQGRIREAGAQDAVEFHPNVDRAQKLACLRRMKVFSVPATYGESFGLYVLEGPDRAGRGDRRRRPVRPRGRACARGRARRAARRSAASPSTGTGRSARGRAGIHGRADGARRRARL
jgi:glycosyltransferase involved in cell wall biosynthesis